MEIDPLDHYTNIGRRLLSLQRMLDARKNNPAHKQNCEEIRAEIARLEDVRRVHAPPEPGADPVPQGGEK
jgi:hypothetical protein